QPGQTHRSAPTLWPRYFFNDHQAEIRLRIKETLMSKRLWIALCLFAPLIVFAQSPRESESQKSYVRAREVLETGIKAMGGLDALRGVNNISREMAGVRTEEGQGSRPIPHRADYYSNVEAPVVNHPRIKHVHDLLGQRLSDSLDDVIFGGQPLRIRNILTKD